MAANLSKYFYFSRLQLRNIRSFADVQELSLCDSNGRPAQWTLILGDNGVGKTTLLQCLAHMRPFPNIRGRKGQVYFDPVLSMEEENKTLERLVRRGSTKAELIATFRIGAKLDGSGLSSSTQKSTEFSANINKKGEIKNAQLFGRGVITEDFEPPLVIGYGAARLIGKSNFNDPILKNPVASLFNARVELFDPAELLHRLNYAKKATKNRSASSRLDSLKEALASLLPDVGNPKHIDISALPITNDDDTSGVQVQTQYAKVSLESLSLGYQTVLAWITDIAWRLFQHYPKSARPLHEPAIVVVDEIDLHLHPEWQRKMRQELLRHFPNIQFIATAHSPLMAQNSLDENLAVVRCIKDHAEIVNEPVIVRGWRLDQVITSELFGFASPFSEEIDQKVKRLTELRRKEILNRKEKKDLRELEGVVDAIAFQDINKKDKEAFEFVRKAAALLKREIVKGPKNDSSKKASGRTIGAQKKRTSTLSPSRKSARRKLRAVQIGRA